MIPRRLQLPHLEPAHRALAEGRYETAFELLEDAARRPQARGARALYHLHLAAADALYGHDGVDSGLRALRSAAEADPALVRHPLYRALHWEFRALHGAPVAEVRRGTRGIADEDDPVAAYHAASALWSAGSVRQARRALDALAPDDLPTYLRWRRASLLGHVLTEAGEHEAAALAFAQAYSAATEPERETVRIHLAAALLELGRMPELLILLADLDDDAVTPEDLGWARQLQGRAELELGNPGRALTLLAEAERRSEDPVQRFGVVHASAQALMAQGRYGEAAARLEAVLAHAPGPERPFALHELAVALLEDEASEEAEACLEELLLDPDYPNHGDATADLAEVRLRRGDLSAARETALRALELGAVGPACLALGTIAFEYFDLDEAVGWLEQAASATAPGDPTWLAAQQLLADVFVQQGPTAAERLLTHARLALAHSDSGSEWSRPLQAYVRQARRWMGGYDRLLN